MASYRVISSDSHIIEPPNLWTDRMDKKKWGSQIPHMIKGGDVDWWEMGKTRMATVGAVTQAGLRFERPQDIKQEGTWDAVRPGAYIPAEHIKDMDVDGVWGGLVYPSTGLPLYAQEDPVLLRDVFAAYNDWLAEFCSEFPDRLKGISMIMLEDGVQEGIEEMRRSADMGLAGVMISSFPRKGQAYNEPMYEPFWAAAEELEMPVALHVTTNRPGWTQVIKDGKAVQTGADRVQHDYYPRMDLCHMIFSGVFERYPNLKAANVEHELGWIPFFIKRMDRTYIERPQATPHRFKSGVLPSDFMRNNVYHSFQEDEIGIQLRHYIGVDNLMWGSDYPHAESTFPKSREILEDILKGVPEKEKAKIVGANAAKLYKY
ncbi:MAG: amidohydrolase [SAR202 cluster bacterium]|nr:amidohydrolase [SAR202 cluster bacterium]